MGKVVGWFKSNAMALSFGTLFIGLHWAWYKLQSNDALVPEHQRKLPPHMEYIVSLKDYFKKPDETKKLP